MARLAGSVHGVVVQTTANARRPASFAWSSAGTDVSGNFTHTEGVRCSSYSTSACASAVLQCRSEEHTSELQPQSNIVCRLLHEKNEPLVICFEISFLQ